MKYASCFFFCEQLIVNVKQGAYALFHRYVMCLSLSSRLSLTVLLIHFLVATDPSHGSRTFALPRRRFVFGRVPALTGLLRGVGSQEQASAKGKVAALTLKNVGGVFVCLMCGMALAVIQSCLEFIWTVRQQAAEENVRQEPSVACFFPWTFREHIARLLY